MKTTKFQRKNRKRTGTQAPDLNDNNITGIVENIIFRSEETGYTVCSIKIEGRQDPTTVVGKCPAIWLGETLTAKGIWNRHSQHGYQFQADLITCIPPTSIKGIERYLASGMIRGIGKINAKRLVEAFGADTLRIIERESKKLEAVEGIGPIRRQRIRDSWKEQQGVRDIMIFLQGHGIGNAQSVRIFRHYGDNAITFIRTNPYKLCEDIWGIGFKTADKIAVSVGIQPTSDIRARAGIVYVLRTITEEGHCFCPAPELILQATALLDIPAEILAEALNEEIKRGTLIKETDNIYITEIHKAEVGVTQKIRRLLSTPSGFTPINAEKAVMWAQKNMHLTFSPMQVKALQSAMLEKACIITGGPGVGKTTIIKALVDVFKARKLIIHLAAPTGRAAKRMSETTSHEAKTIHRMLKYLPNTGRFEHGSNNTLKGDVFIIDEMSMVNISLLNDLLSAIPDKALLIMVGDADQLPSIGPGNTLCDLINSNAIVSKKLDTIFRQKSGGLIVQNAHHVNNGEPLEQVNDEDSDFYFLPANEPDQVIQKMISLIAERIPEKFGFNPMTDIQVLTPMRKNQLGADNLNAVLQEAINPVGDEISRFGRLYRIRDRVMQIKNNYDKDIFNGDIGHISRIDTVDQEIIVEMDGRPIKYKFHELDELIHAYACSIHKSQGNEYPAVIILLATQHFKLLQRNLLYTAITRGRKLVCLIGSQKAVYIAINNNKIRLRRTSLQQRLQAAMPGQ